MDFDEIVYRFEVFDFRPSTVVLKGLDDRRTREFDRRMHPMLVSVQVLKHGM